MQNSLLIIKSNCRRAYLKSEFVGANPQALRGCWALRKYFITKEGTSICAFAVGGAFDAAKGGVVIAAGHTVS